jgi:hypothetical protein
VSPNYNITVVLACTSECEGKDGSGFVKQKVECMNAKSPLQLKIKPGCQWDVPLRLGAEGYGCDFHSGSASSGITSHEPVGNRDVPAPACFSA